MTAPYKAEKTGSYTCGNCMAVFRVIAHHRAGSRLIACQHCDLKFTRGCGQYTGWILAGGPYDWRFKREKRNGV